MFKEFNILKIFFEKPIEEFNVREIAKLAKITPATSSKYLKEFYKKSILNYRKERILDLYKSNIESEDYIDLKKYYNIKKLRDSGFIEELNNFYLKPTIILFGSMSNGLDVGSSDIDLVIVSEKKQEFSKIKEFEKKLKREIQMFVVKELKNKHLINNVLNGVILQGELIWI